MKVIFGLGSNTSYNNMDSVELLANGTGKLIKLLKNYSISSLYETKAMYVQDQNNFFNLAVRGEVDDSTDPYWLLSEINRIEAFFGRDRDKEFRFGPRSLDIDIEECGSYQLNTPKLILPHPRFNERKFVLLPVLEILNESADEEKRSEIIKLLSQLKYHKDDDDIKLCSENIQKRFISCIF